MNKRKNMKNNDTFLDVVIKGSSIILIVISIVITVVPYLLFLLKEKNILILSDKNQLIIIAFSALITLIFAISLYCIGTIKRFREIILRNNLEELGELTKQLKKSSEIITNTVIPRKNIVMESFLIPPNNINQFYEILINLRENAQDRNIRLMNFGLHPFQENNKNNNDNNYIRQYFNDELSFYKKDPNASIYKIVSIHTKAKLDEYKKIVNQAKKMSLRNFHLGYLNIKKFDNYPPDIIGVDIISDVVLFMNPLYARITDESDYTALYIKSKEISETYRLYHKALWREIEDDEERGLILYGGKNGGISPKIEEYWTRIEKQINEDLSEYIPSIKNNKNFHLNGEKKEKTSLFKIIKSFIRFQSKK